MSRLKIIGGQSFLTGALREFPITVRGGHTVFEYTDTDGADTAETVVTYLTNRGFTMLDTSQPTKPSRVATLDRTKEEAEYTLIPQIAGGLV